MQSLTSIRENFPSSVEIQLLRDMHGVVSRITRVVSESRVQEPERTLVLLLELALTMESTFAVWCWCHVHLERRSPVSEPQLSLKGRAQAALEDADRIAARLYEITGKSFQLEWLPSVNGPFSAEGWTLDRSIRDHIAISADRIALESYARLTEFARKHSIPAGSIFEDIAYSRKKRLAMSSDVAS